MRSQKKLKDVTLNMADPDRCFPSRSSGASGLMCLVQCLGADVTVSVRLAVGTDLGRRAAFRLEDGPCATGVALATSQFT